MNYPLEYLLHQPLSTWQAMILSRDHQNIRIYRNSKLPALQLRKSKNPITRLYKIKNNYNTRESPGRLEDSYTGTRHVMQRAMSRLVLMFRLFMYDKLVRWVDDSIRPCTPTTIYTDYLSYKVVLTLIYLCFFNYNFVNSYKAF